MANRYWVGGTETWDTTAGTKWATTSGGTGGESVPTSSDDVFFDANSGAVTVTTGSSDRPCNSLNCTGFTGTLTGSTFRVDINNNLTLGASSIHTSTLTLELKGVGSHTITTNGNTSDTRIYQNSPSGTYTLVGHFTGSNIFLDRGTLVTDNYNITLSGGLFSSTSLTRGITLGTSTVTLNQWSTANAANLTLSAANSTIILVGTGSPSMSMGAGSPQFGTVEVNTTTAATLGGSFIQTPSITQLTINPSSDVRFTSGMTMTLGGLTADGTSLNPIILRSSSSGNTFTLTKSSGTVSVEHCTISDSEATGGALWIAENSTDDGDNTGWNFVEGFLSIPTGSYTYTGINFSLKRLYQLAINTGVYTYTGINWLMKKVYVMLMATGTYTYTGINWLYGFPLRVLRATTGSYSYTGFNLGFFRTLRLAINTGVYVYTGFIDRLTKVFRMAINTGSYIYTGVNWSMGKAYRILIETGVYVYRGFAFWKWKNTAKTVSTWVNGIKNSSLWSNGGKSVSSWTSSNKSSASTFTETTKSSSTWEELDKS